MHSTVCLFIFSFGLLFIFYSLRVASVIGTVTRFTTTLPNIGPRCDTTKPKCLWHHKGMHSALKVFKIVQLTEKLTSTLFVLWDCFKNQQQHFGLSSCCTIFQLLTYCGDMSNNHYTSEYGLNFRRERRREESDVVSFKKCK